MNCGVTEKGTTALVAAEGGGVDRLIWVGWGWTVETKTKTRSYRPSTCEDSPTSAAIKQLVECRLTQTNTGLDNGMLD